MMMRSAGSAGGRPGRRVDASAIALSTGTITWRKDIAATHYVFIEYQLNTYTLEPVAGRLAFNHALPATWGLVADYDTGVPIPYSDIYGPAHGYDTFIPANGDLVAFHGDFDNGQTHGSFVSSTIAARPFGNLASPFFEVFGTAPRAKIIGIAACCNAAGPIGLFGSIEDQRDFAAVGYDGLPNTGDEASIISNSPWFVILSPSMCDWAWISFTSLMASSAVPVMMCICASHRRGSSSCGARAIARSK